LTSTYTPAKSLKAQRLDIVVVKNYNVETMTVSAGYMIG